MESEMMNWCSIFEAGFGGESFETIVPELED